ncbi:hypothetical protein C8Q74DRAFT_1315119 [Fomes fomentarius]|nr:hypothetical protein C8Q74DRAFT_1315119 [Fomes fomentarius]
MEQFPDLTGCVALVTGRSAGIVYHNVKSGSSGCVDRLAKQISSQETPGRPDILILNVGIRQAWYGLTPDGLERHFEVSELRVGTTYRTTYVVVHRPLPLIQSTTSKEINEERDGTLLYGHTKLGQIFLVRGLARRKLSGLRNPILAISAWTETYGATGKVLEVLSITAGKSAEEGAEANINESNWSDFQGNCYDERYGKPGSQAKDQALADKFWTLCADLTEELLGERLD